MKHSFLLAYKGLVVLLCPILFYLSTDYGQINSLSAPLPNPREINTSFYDQMNTIFGSLEKHRVPKGLLLDYAFEFTNLSNYYGTLLEDCNYVDPGTYWDIYRTLLTSRIHTNAPVFTSPEVLDSLWFTQR